MVTILHDSNQFDWEQGPQQQYGTESSFSTEKKQNEGKKIPEFPVEIESAQDEIKTQVFEIVSNEEWIKSQLDLNEEKEKSKSFLDKKIDKFIITRDGSDKLPEGVTKEEWEKASKELPKEMKDVNTRFVWDTEEIRNIAEQKIHSGDLSYEKYKNLGEIPATVEGDLLFSDCLSVEGLKKLPKKIKGSVYLEGLPSEEAVNFFLSQIEEIRGHLYVNKNLNRININLQKFRGMLISR